jgi:histidyl-tRNA synthetase
MAPSSELQTLKGFRDYVNQDARKRQWLSNSIRRVFERHGFEPLETPALEYESLLLGKYGDEADKLIYRFKDQGGRNIALRYDQTVPTARVVAQYRNQLSFPYRRYQIQDVWRAEKPQKGRYRQFVQCDADIIGTSTPITDAEILAVYAAIYYELGIGSIRIKVNDRKSLIQTITQAGVEDDMVFSTIQTIDKLDKKPPAEVEEELVKKGITETTAARLLASLSNQSLPTELETTIRHARSLGVKEETIEFAPALARGLDYYTGLIFEGIIPEYPVGSVGGGGRYDNLIQDLVGTDMPAIGFGIGFDRTLEAAEALGKTPNQTAHADVYVAVFSEELTSAALEIVTRLRNEGISVDCSLEATKMQKQMKYADTNQIPFVVIVGPDEEKNGTVILKNMKDRTQQSIDKETVADIVRSAI